MDWGRNAACGCAPAPFPSAADVMHTTFDYRGRPRPIMVRTRHRGRAIRAHGNVYALSSRDRSWLLMPRLEKAGQAA